MFESQLTFREGREVSHESGTVVIVEGNTVGKKIKVTVVLGSF